MRPEYSIGKGNIDYESTGFAQHETGNSKITGRLRQKMWSEQMASKDVTVILKEIHQRKGRPSGTLTKRESM